VTGQQAVMAPAHARRRRVVRQAVAISSAPRWRSRCRAHGTGVNYRRLLGRVIGVADQDLLTGEDHLDARLKPSTSNEPSS